MKTLKSLAAVLAVCLPAPTFAQNVGDSDIQNYLQENRGSHVLLRQGTYQSTLTFGVAMRGSDFGIGSYSATQLTSSVGLSFGLNDRTELFLDVPVYWVRSTQTFLDESVTAQSQGGSAVIGVRRVLAFEGDRHPEIVGMVSASLPLGSGAEPALRFGLDRYRMLDPVLLSFGIGVGVGTRSRQTQIELRGGMDFAISDRFGLGVDVSWVNNGGRFGDPLRDGLSLTLSGNVTSESGSMSFRPYVSIGATSGANNAVLGISLSRRW